LHHNLWWCSFFGVHRKEKLKFLTKTLIIMKKFLLFGAAVMLACAANAQTLEKQWQHDFTALGTNVRNIVAVGNEIAVANMGTGKVEFYDATGLTAKAYDVNTFAANNSVGDHGTDSVGNPTFKAYTIGRAIAIDAVGNIVVNLNFPNAPSSTNFVAIAPDGTMKHIACEVPSPGEAGRADFLGAAGDVLTNGYIATAIHQKNYVAVYNVFDMGNGPEQDKDYSYLVNADEGVSLTNEVKVFFADKTVAEDAETAPTMYFYHRGQSGVRVAENGAKDFVNMGEPFVQGKAGSTGADAFVVNGTTYIVMPMPVGGARKTGFAVYNVAAKEMVASCDGLLDADVYTNDFSASVNEDGTVNIAQLVQGKYLAMFKLTLPASAIEEVAADNAAVEYYNLQGVKVANPENGVFVKKQGAKATKVVL